MWTEAERYLAHCRLSLASLTVKDRRKMLCYYSAWLDKKRLHYRDVTSSQSKAFMNRKRWGGSHFNKMRRTLVEFYAFIGGPNPFEGTPCRKKGAPKLPRLPPRCSIPEMIEKITHECEELRLRNRLLIELAYGSGLRRSELSSLNVEDVDLTQRTAHVLGKGNKRRVVPLTARSVELMCRYLSERQHRRMRGPLLHSYRKGKRIPPDVIGLLFKELTGYNTHSFRHACATHMLQSGCNIRYIQELLGHCHLSTTQIYTHIDRSHLAKVVTNTHPRAKSGADSGAAGQSP